MQRRQPFLWYDLAISPYFIETSMRYIFAAAVIAVAGLSFFAGFQANRQPIQAASQGLLDQAAPAFELPYLLETGRKADQTIFLGQVTLLNVWASWCVSCKQEHPQLMRLAQESAVRLYGVNFLDNPADARALLQKHGNPYAGVLLDENGATAKAYAINGTPISYIIDKKGVIRHRHTGAITEKALLEEILPLIHRLQAETAPA
jgi:cytochrome c biogenesis protein CcmG/thiol:disulfide interchange protein DsbE